MNASDSSNRQIWIKRYRFLVFLMTWTAIIIRIYLGIVDVINGADPLVYFGNMFSYFTMQSNVMVGIWLLFVLLLGGKEERALILHPIVHGAICLYITATFLIFAVFLSPYYQPTGLEGVYNILMHYVIPFAFIAEWIVSELDTRYEYNYLIYYTSYPFAYLFYTVIRGFITGFYPYYFFDLNQISILDLIVNVIMLIILFTILGTIYITINRKLNKSKLG